jgi:hypothetical protein
VICLNSTQSTRVKNFLMFGCLFVVFVFLSACVVFEDNKSGISVQ